MKRRSIRWAPGNPKGVMSNIPLDVYDLFDRLTLEIIKRGWTRYSADAVLHRIRWYHHVEKGNREFKCNNNWTAVLARWWLKKHPDHPGFFELRERRMSDGDQTPPPTSESKKDETKPREIGCDCVK